MKEEVAEVGYAALERLVTQEWCAEVSAALDEVLAAEDDIAEERRWRTDTYRVAYALAAKHPVLLRACTDPAPAALARAVLGDDCVLAGCNGLDLVPGGPPQDLHRDHLVPTPGVTLFLHVVVAIDAFTSENGATRVVPASHLAPLSDVDPARFDELAGQAVSVPLGVGGAVAFDGALVHAAGANRTDQRRRALHLFYARPWVQPHWDLRASVGDAEAERLSEDQRALLGFGTGPRRWDPGTRRAVRR